MISEELKRRVVWLVVFSIAMGFLETAVVVYLRELYYPEGFSFPMVTMNAKVAIIELLREAATVIMLLGVGWLGGQTFNQRFAFFITSFAIWDIFYYVFLKVLLDWPESLFTWDILFLIPVPWIGPVLAPLLICVTMLCLSFVLVVRDGKSPTCRLQLKEWTLLIAGSLVVLASWTIDYLSFSKGRDPLVAASTFVPLAYNWYLFGAGELILLSAIILFWRRTSKAS